MRLSRLLSVVAAILLVLPTVSCNLIGQNPLSAIGSLVPQVTVEDTQEATAESTKLVRPKTTAATALPKATITKNAEATVKPKATTRVTATKKATQAPTKVATIDSNATLPIGDLLLSDDFTDPASGWGEITTDQFVQTYQDGKYVITVHDVNYISWSKAGQTYADFVVEVEAEKTSGPDDGEYGILFRYQDENNFYVFNVNAEGSCVVSALVNNEWVALIPWTTNDAIQTGTATNKLAIVAQGMSLSFYVNDVKVGEVEDSTFAEGDIALVAGTQAEGEFVASYLRVNVWKLADSASPTFEANSRITKGAKLYSETFSNSMSGWDDWDGASSRGGYINGKYFIEVLEVDQLSWSNANQSFDDFVIEVNATKESGPDDAGYGIIVRYMDSDNFYYFVVTSDGQYSFGYYLYNTRDYIVYWTGSDAINPGNASNKLSVACKGTHIVLSINDTVVEDFTDDNFSYGDIGLLAATNSEAGVRVIFEDLNVWEAK